MAMGLVLNIYPFVVTAPRQSTAIWSDQGPHTVTSYVYAPGVLVSEILVARYCPYFKASTGEIVTCSKGIEVLRLPATSCNLSEITIKQVDAKERKIKKKQAQKERTRRQSFVSLLLTPFRVFWYSASYMANWVLGFSLSTPKGTRLKESLSMYWADPTKVNLAQEKDLALFKQVYDKHLAELQDVDGKAQSIVLYGTSRGSATVFNFCALYRPSEVKALVCEGLFDSIEHIFTETKSVRVRGMIKLLPKVTEFKHDGILPIKVAQEIPRDMPVLLITSLKDKVVPHACTMNVYRTLRETGHTNVHILVCKKASHIGYPWCSEKKLYESVVHAFYKKYGLPHIPEYADAGYDYFMSSTQPEA